MPIEKLRYHSALKVPREFAWNAYMRPGMFDRLVPPWQRVRTTRQTGTVEPGDLREIELAAGPFRLQWLAVHEQFEDGRLFSDRQVKGPFRSWRHQHRFVDDGEMRCTIHDEIEFELPISRISHPLGLSIARSELRRMFRYRHFTTYHDLRTLYGYNGQEKGDLIVEGSPLEVVTQLRAVLNLAGYSIVSPGSDSHSVTTTRIDVTADEGGGIDAHLTFPKESGKIRRSVRSAALVSPSSPLMRVAHAMQFIDVGADSFAGASVEWTTIDDFVFAVLRLLIDDGSRASVLVRHSQIASLSDLVEAISVDEAGVRRRRVPSIIVDRLNAELRATQPVPPIEGEIVDTRSRFQSMSEAVAVLSGRA